MSLLSELKRRNVLRVGAAYIVTAWLIVQVAETLFPVYGLSDAAVRMVVNVLAVGLVPVLVLAWVFEWTPEGLKRDSEVDNDAPSSVTAAKRLDRIILAVLAVALGYFAFDKFVLDPQREAKQAEQQQAELQQAREEGRSEALVESYGDASIAVMAFENMSPDPDQAYFADGISEEILNLLAGIPELRVISRSSSFTYKGRAVPVPQIARELNVAHILEGSVRKAGNQVRVTAQLIDGRSDTHLWSRTWDRELENVFAIQDEIASDVVEELQVTLTGAMPASRRTKPEVYALVLQAKQLAELGMNDPALVVEARDLLDQALSIDPVHVPALELRLFNVYRMQIAGQISAEESGREWQTLRERILALEPDNAVVASYDAWELFQDERNIEKAALIYANLLPRALNDAETLRVIGGFLRRIGKFDQAIPVLKRCVRVDPLKHSCSWQLKETLLWAGELEQSRIQADRLNRFYGRKAGVNDVYRTLLEGRPEEARQLAGTLGNSMEKSLLLALAAHDLGEMNNFDEQVAAFHASDKDGASRQFYLSNAVGLYAYLGQADRAFQYLDEWVDTNGTDAYRDAMSPWYKPLHGDPRWDAFLERVGLNEARLDAIQFPLPPQLKP